MVPLDHFLNTVDFERLFQLQGGLLAKGPKRLLNAYARCLEASNMKWSIIGERKPSHFSNLEDRGAESNLQTLTIGQTSAYIIAEDFIFSPL